MATQSDTSPQDWKKRETFGSALVQIAVVAALLGGAVYFVYNNGATRQAVAEILKEARGIAVKGNPEDLREGLKKLDEGLAIDANHPDALALAAWLHTALWQQHAEPGADAKAKDFLSRAKAAEAKGEDRYATEAWHKLAGGDAQGAEDFIEDLRKRGASAPKLSYVLGMSLRQQGNITLAKTAFNLAMDKGWRDPQFFAAYAETTLQEGGGQTGLDQFNKALQNNPDYLRAKPGLAIATTLRRMPGAADKVKDVLSNEARLTPPLKAYALAAAAFIAESAGSPDEAITLADQALAANPDEAWAYQAKGNALATKKDSGAPAAYGEAIKRAPQAALLYFDAASRLLAAGQGAQAMELLGKYEAFFKNVRTPTTEGKDVAYLDRDDKYWIARGDLLRDAGKLEDALASYETAINCKSMNVTKATLKKGQLLLQQNQVDKALEVLQDISPPDGSGNQPEAYWAMGDVFFAQKKYADALQYYFTALGKLKVASGMPKEQLLARLDDVAKRLKSVKENALAKEWVEQGKPLLEGI